MEKMMKQQELTNKNNEASIRNIERQIGQLSKQGVIERPSSSLPSDTIPNPKEECKAIWLRNGRTLVNDKEETKKPMKSNKKPIEKEEASNKEVRASKQTLKKLKEKDDQLQDLRKWKQIMEESSQGQKQVEKTFTPPLPYPQRFNKETKDQHLPKFLEVFKKLEINIPLAEALEQMPLYAKFLKELINKKRSWHEKETVLLTEECSAVIQRGIPPKLKDPGSFVVSCIIAKMTLDKVLCELGASINLMPLSMMRKLAIEELKPTRMSLVMVDRSIKTPNGIVENLLVKFVVPKKDGMIVVVIEKNEPIPTRTVTGWRMCIDFRMLNDSTRKDHFLLPFIDQMLEKLASHDRKGSENQVADHLSRLPQETVQEASHPVNESFPDEHLLQIQQAPWFADIANYKVGRKIPKEFTKQQVKKLLNEANKFLWDEPFLFRRCSDGMITKCVPEGEMRSILWHCHGSAYGGHFGPERTAANVLQSGFYWPTIFKDPREFFHQCNECQRGGGLTK
ncbi:uncharacterized protein LOC130934248 [Arachis stenosperma]|uniref:uncharacterized protein LOC130934248 n=1 Tax=Arachis stenosperma TaxID=217475 RepID=UPI0025AD9CC0|nr:uncharacterized protein LOC130934248 [Arachis stenosperma]